MCIHRSTSGGCEGVKLGALPKRNTLKRVWAKSATVRMRHKDSKDTILTPILLPIMKFFLLQAKPGRVGGAERSFYDQSPPEPEE